MSLQLHSVLGELVEAPGLQRAEQASGLALTQIPAAGLIAVVSNTPDAEPDEAAFLRFGEVSAMLYRERALIPIRFGCQFHDHAAVEALLKERHAAYLTLLRELDDCVEMSVRVPAPQSPLPTASGSTTGRDYLRMRQRAYSASEDAGIAADQWENALRGKYRKRSVEAAVIGGRSMYSAYYLVERMRLAAFSEAIATSGVEASGGWVSGPWPPYNFVLSADPVKG